MILKKQKVIIHSIKQGIGKLPIASSVKSAIIQKGRAYLYRRRLKTLPTTVLVYQMGKVASSSIHQSIEEVYKGYCFHTHYFERYHKVMPLVGEVHRQYYRNKIPLKIVTMVREPIDRNISAFFQWFRKTTGSEFQKEHVDMEALMASFLEKFDHQQCLVWFDKHMLKHFNIDVFNRDFPERGYDIFIRGNIELLLLKHDLGDTVKEKLIGEFLDLEDFSLIRTNVSASKDYGQTYKKFKTMQLPQSYIDWMLGSRYAQHFYNNELNALRKKWEA
jgi:hypothetical protein